MSVSGDQPCAFSAGLAMAFSAGQIIPVPSNLPLIFADATSAIKKITMRRIDLYFSDGSMKLVIAIIILAEHR